MHATYRLSIRKKIESGIYWIGSNLFPSQQTNKPKMSNATREFEYDSGDFTTEDWYEEADTERGVDYYGDGNNDNEEDDGHVICFEDQSIGVEVVGQDSIYPGN